MSGHRYGFYKVNKTPRGSKNPAESHVWEFSHPHFLRGRPELLDGIRRRALDSDNNSVRYEAPRETPSIIAPPTYVPDAQTIGASFAAARSQRQADETTERLNLALQQNNALRHFASQLRDALVQVVDYMRVTHGGQLPFPIHIPSFQVDTLLPDGHRLSIMQAQVENFRQQQLHHHHHQQQQQQQQQDQARTRQLSQSKLEPSLAQPASQTGPAIMVTDPQHFQHHMSMQMQRAQAFTMAQNTGWASPSDLGSPAVGTPAGSDDGSGQPGFMTRQGRPMAGKPRRSFDSEISRAGAALSLSSPGGALEQPMLDTLRGRSSEMDAFRAAYEQQRHQQQRSASMSAPSTAPTSGPPGAGWLGPGSRVGLGVMDGDGAHLLTPGAAMMLATQTPLPPSPNVAVQQGQTSFFSDMGSSMTGSPTRLSLSGASTSSSAAAAAAGSGAFSYSSLATSSVPPPAAEPHLAFAQHAASWLEANNADTSGMDLSHGGLLGPAPKSQRTATRRTASGTSDHGHSPLHSASTSGGGLSPHLGTIDGDMAHAQAQAHAHLHGGGSGYNSSAGSRATSPAPGKRKVLI